MKSFLDKVVEDIISKKKADNILFILPSRRAGVFLKQSWVKYFKDQSCWIPQILTIEEFMENVSGLKLIDSTTLLFEFYEAYKQTNSKPENFEGYIKWIQTIISDLNDIDRNLIDANKFFNYIASIERMDKWEPRDLNYETDLIQNNLLFWKEIEKLYYKVRENLKKQLLGYQGMIFREANDNIKSYLKESPNHFVFAGFNALTKSEEKIIRLLKTEKRASIYWDSDEYYLNDFSQESGSFLRNIKNWNTYSNEPFSFIEKKISQQKNIHIIGTPKQTGQVKLAGNILNSLIKKGEKLNETAFVLADENLLEPSLNALPEKVEKVNVTMGYPLQNIPLSTFISTFIQLFINYKKYNNKGLYHEDLLAFLKNSYTDYLVDNRTQLINEIITQNKIFVSPDLFNNTSKSFYEIIAINKDITPKDLINKTNSLLAHLSKKKKIIEDNLELEYVFRFSTIWENLGVLINKFPFIEDLKTLQTIYNQILFSETLSFYGEPLHGLQLMGMLETRLLDFKNIIITSVNEGILPKGRTENTFIPFDIRKNMGLTTFQENDAIFAYHFYRLIQRAENIYLIYNTENDEYGAGEKSRFLTQLEIELPYKIKNHIAAEKTTEKPIKPLQIEKSEEMINQLQQIAKKGFSPSALNSYIRNPIIFYYQNILKLNDVEEIEETIDSRTLGIVVHNTLEELYKPLLNEILSINLIDKLLAKSETILQKQFKEVYKNGDYSKGKNLLIYSVAKRFIINFLNYEKQELSAGNEIIVKHLEIELKAPFKLNNKTVFVRGFADRIDEFNGIKRVIDYKTGIAETNKLSIKDTDFEKVIKTKDYDKAMQLLLYSYMYLNNFRDEKICAGIISFRKLKEGIMLLKINKSSIITEKELENFKPQLSKLLEEILNREIPIIENIE